MNCKETEKSISAFMNDELDVKELAGFIDHIDGCEECKEELTIQYLVTEGLEQLELENKLNLQEELLSRLDAARRKVHFAKVLKRVLLAIHVVTFILIIITVFLVLKII